MVKTQNSELITFAAKHTETTLPVCEIESLQTTTSTSSRSGKTEARYWVMSRTGQRYPLTEDEYYQVMEVFERYRRGQAMRDAILGDTPVNTADKQ